MKFIVDMGIARATVTFLRVRGYDAIHLRDEGLQRLSDEQVVRKAQVEGRIIMTHNLDFSRIVALSRAKLPSVVTFRLEDMRPAQVNRYLEEVLICFAKQLKAGALISVNERSIRVRLLPVKSERKSFSHENNLS